MSIERRYSVAMVAACRFPANYGSPGAIREMSVELAAMGHEIHVVTYPDGDDLPLGAVHLHRAGERHAGKAAQVGPSLEKPWHDLRTLRELCRVIKRHRIEIIHAHNYEGALIGAAAKFITRRPLVYHAVNLMADELHTYRFIRPKFVANAIARVLDWVTPRLADRVIAVSPELKEALVGLGVAPERIAVVPCGIEPRMFAAADPSRLQARYQLEGRPVVLYTGVISAFQRIDYLLWAFGVVHREVPEAVLMIVTPLENEPDLPAHQALARELGLMDCVIWVGPHTLEELPDYLACGTVTVVPRCDCPGHPIKLLNYMMAGKPSVCFAGAAKGVTHGLDAWIVPDHDWQALGEGTVRLLREPALAERLGAAARKTVTERFDWSVLCREVERIYGEVLDGRNQRHSARAESALPFKKTAAEARDSL